MEELLKLLEAKFDEYQELHFKNQDKQKSDYYLYVGMTGGVREALEIVEEFIKNESDKPKPIEYKSPSNN